MQRKTQSKSKAWESIFGNANFQDNLERDVYKVM